LWGYSGFESQRSCREKEATTYHDESAQGPNAHGCRTFHDEEPSPPLNAVDTVETTQTGGDERAKSVSQLLANVQASNTFAQFALRVPIQFRNETSG
jgi:hypothetical protein